MIGGIEATVSKGLARLKWRLRQIDSLWAMARKDLHSPLRVGTMTRLGLWRRGFHGDAHALYGLKHRSASDYLSEFALYVRTPLINGQFAALLDNKILFYELFGREPGLVPTVWGVILDGRVASPAAPPWRGGDPMGFLGATLEREGKVVLKAAFGRGGEGVRVLERRDGILSANGTPIEEESLRRLLAGAGSLLVTEHVQQHRAIAALHPATINTVRLLTMLDDAGTFIAGAVLKIGRRRSVPVDNWIRGGLSASIDLDTGRLGPACGSPERPDRLDWYRAHPETGAAIEGMIVPHWQQLRDRVLALVARVGYLKYVGWDIAITADGFRILEGNNAPALKLMQVHQPLLANPRVRAFYRHHRVISGKD